MSSVSRYGLSYVGLQYLNVYGPHQDQTAAYISLIPIMLKKIDANATPVFHGDGTQTYDFITARDAARCNMLALQAETVDYLYSFGTGVRTSIKLLCEMILRLRDSKLSVTHNPYSVEDVRRLA